MKETKERLKIVNMVEGDKEKIAKYKKFMRYPLYYECYLEALSAIFQNLYDLEQEEKIKAERTWSRENIEEYREGCENKKKNISLLYKMPNNVIAFLGARGSGKTSAITDFGNVLRYFQTDKDFWFKQLGSDDEIKCFMQRTIRFHVLKPIEASLLEEKENLLELIWANMYEVFERKINQYGWEHKDHLKKDFIRKFEELYKNYMALGREDAKEELGYSVLARLRNMPSSGKIRTLFAELLEVFFDLLEKHRECEQYLVVTIDDLDLNLEQGYAMLEQIHKYLSHPRIIVLLAVDYGQLGIDCEIYYSNNLTRQTYAEKKRMEKQANQLTAAYLIKNLPEQNRIYLPSEEIITQEIAIVENVIDGVQNKDEEIYIPIKHFLMQKIAERTGIYYDGNGMKTHFCIPCTIRELVSYNKFLDMLSVTDMMQCIDHADTKICIQSMENREYNLKRFIKNILGTMAYRRLDAEQMANFNLLQGCSTERRAQYVVEFGKQWIRSNRLRDTVDENSYAYGNLLESLYTWGRSKYDDKPLIHVIMASLTAEMTKTFYSYIYHNYYSDDELGMKSLSILQSFMGSGFGNKWTGAMLPHVRYDVTGERPIIASELGYIPKAQISMICWEYMIEKPTVETKEEAVSEIIRQIKEKKIVEELECFATFFNNYKLNGRTIETLEYKVDVIFQKGILRWDGLDTIDLEFGFYATTAEFDILGFLGKILYDENQYRQIEENLKNTLITVILEIANNPAYSGKKLKEGEVKDEVESLLEKRSIWKQGEVRRSELNAFPFYNLDLAYNVLKRARRECKRDKEFIGANEIYEYIQRIYGYIAIELLKEDRFYAKDEEKGKAKTLREEINIYNTTGFAKKFATCPFVKTFGVRYMDEGANENKTVGELSEDFADNLSRAIRTLTIVENVEDPD